MYYKHFTFFIYKKYNGQIYSPFMWRIITGYINISKVHHFSFSRSYFNILILIIICQQYDTKVRQIFRDKCIYTKKRDNNNLTHLKFCFKNIAWNRMLPLSAFFNYHNKHISKTMQMIDLKTIRQARVHFYMVVTNLLNHQK